MPKLFYYVGPEDIRKRAAGTSPGSRVGSPQDFQRWVLAGPRGGLTPVTFVVDARGALRVADRGSEHVACAGGGPEPESWPAVAAALERIGVNHPGRFTHPVVFRRCTGCGQRNIVKDGWFVCEVCGADLPAAWNF